MGIRSLWTTFRRSFKIIDPIGVEPLKIGIDMFSLVYTHRSFIDELLDLIKSWSSAGHQITCVWDGTAPKDKQEIIEQRRQVREAATESKSELQEYLEKFEKDLSEDDIEKIKSSITSLTWQGWHLTGSLKREIKEKLGSSIQHIYAPGEADDILISMAFQGEIDIILSLDSDLFAMGGERIWRLLRIHNSWVTEDIQIEEICNNQGITLAMLQDACFLAGWERCHLSGLAYMPFQVALNRIKYYSSLQDILKKFPVEDPSLDESLERLKILKKESKDRWIGILERRK
jgi:5'-3' exonuclease